MLRLIAYDIKFPRRLRRMALLCKDFGIRGEYSVFECDLSDGDFRTFWEQANDLIDPEQDRIIAYSLCESCVSRIQYGGNVMRQMEKKRIYVF